jgi:hypothetical protein
MLKKVFLSALLSQNAEDAILKVSPTIGFSELLAGWVSGRVAREAFLFCLILREQNCSDGEFPIKKMSQ